MGPTVCALSPGVTGPAEPSCDTPSEPPSVPVVNRLFRCWRSPVVAPGLDTESWSFQSLPRAPAAGVPGAAGGGAGRGSRLLQSCLRRPLCQGPGIYRVGVEGRAAASRGVPRVAGEPATTRWIHRIGANLGQRRGAGMLPRQRLSFRLQKQRRGNTSVIKCSAESWPALAR